MCLTAGNRVLASVATGTEAGDVVVVVLLCRTVGRVCPRDGAVVI